MKPSDACSELGALGNAYRNTSEVFNGSSGFVLWDLNADYTYKNKKAQCVAVYNHKCLLFIGI